jgi:hypothetical protein
MRADLFCLPISLLLALSSAVSQAADLIKVTNDANAKCVEYYDYKGAMYCSTKALSSQVVDPNIREYETQKIVFDERPWQATWGKKTSDSTTVEYVPMGDDINNWNELVTSQAFSGMPQDATPKEFAQTIINNIEKSGFKPIVNFISDEPNQVIFEFRIESPENQMQDELQIIKKVNNSFYVLHYVIKKSDMGKANREKWLKNLSNSSIK